MLDLYNNKYDRETLKSNIYAVKLIDILKTQTIDVSFAVRYILNSNYQFHDEDLKINVNTVLKYQPHIKKKEIYKEIQNYESDDDSIEDFESYCNRNL
jgi:hypothetical protein